MNRKKKKALSPDEVGFYADTPISIPVVSPEAEIGQMNGFAWTDEGLRVAMGVNGNFMVDELSKLRTDDTEPWWLLPTQAM